MSNDASLERVELNELIEPERPICYGVLKPGPFVEGGTPLVRILDIAGDELSTGGLFRISDALDKEFARSRLEGGELLLSIQGTVGRVAVFPRGIGPANISRTIARLAFTDTANSPFFRHWFRSQEGQRAIDTAIVGSTRSSLNIGVLRRLSVPCFGGVEKGCISEILDTLDTAIRETEAIIVKLKAVKQGLLHDLLTRGIDTNGELRPPRVEAPHLYRLSPLGWVPREWEQTNLGARIRFMNGYGFPERYQNRSEGQVPFFKVSDQSNMGNERELRYANNYVSRELATKKGWKLLPKDGVAFAKVGAALLLNRRRLLAQESLVDNNMMVAVPQERIHSRWLYWFLQSVDFGLFVQPGALPSVNQGQLGSLVAIFPDMQEQESIATRLDQADQMEELERGNLAKLAQLKAGLMDDLLTGRVRVTTLLDN